MTILLTIQDVPTSIQHITSLNSTPRRHVITVPVREVHLVNLIVRFESNSEKFSQSVAGASEDGGRMLYFGTNSSEAQQALNIILYYQMNDQCFVGRPDASLKYWLVNNNSPVGTYPSEDCISFNLSNIEVVNINSRWKIVDGNHILLDFANVEEEARKSYEVLQHYAFNHICFVGRPDPSMEYFRR